MSNYGTKSGFEIRADLLNQAQGLLEMNAQREVDAHYFNVDNKLDMAKLPVVEITTDQVIETAKQLNEFVNEK
jgi:Glu-tRNA(Gln) amidotransferase subunit E-like FAD-binding protein